MKRKIIYLITGLAAFFVYYNALNNDFVFDDESVVQNNMSITKLSNIPKFFTAEEGFHKVIGRYYRPVVSTLYAVDYAVWGLNPFGFHLTNIIIHTLASLLLLSILLKIFGEYKNGLLAAFIGAIIFAVHPIHTEAVSWISGRTDSLTTMFFFLSFLFYIKYSDEKKSAVYLIISLTGYFFGLLSKEMIVTVPVLMLVYDYFFRKRDLKWFRENSLPYILFAGLTVLFVVIRYFALKDIVDRTTYMYFYGEEGSTAFYTMLKTLPVYFRLLFIPVNLLYHYNGVLPDSYSLADIKVLLSLLFITVMAVASFYIHKKYGEISFVILFFFISLLPVMNIIPTMNYMAERFLYLTSFALSVLISYVIVRFMNEKNTRIVTAGFLIIAAVFTYLTFMRNADWKNNDTLYMTAEGKDGSVLLVNAGNVYANKKNYAEAEKRYRRAIEIRDNSVLAHHNLGLIYLLRGDIDSAEIRFKKGLSIDSLAPDGYFQLANICQQRGDIPSAIAYLEKLQNVVPDYRQSKSILDMLKSGQTGMPQDGIPPGAQNNQVAVYEKRSYQYYSEGRYEEAIKDLNEAIKLNPESSSGYMNNIAMCYLAMKNHDRAEEYFKKAIDKDKKNINAYGGLAELYLQTGKVGNAKEVYMKLLEINPGDLNAKMRLDSLNKKQN